MDQEESGHLLGFAVGQVAETYLALSSVQHQCGRLDDSIVSIKKAFELWKMHFKTGIVGYGALLRDGEAICHLCHSLGKYTKSLVVAKDCLAIRKRSSVVKSTTEQMINLLDIAADSLERTGEMGKAVQVRQNRGLMDVNLLPSLGMFLYSVPHIGSADFIHESICEA